jgi:hypothetical protein
MIFRGQKVSGSIEYISLVILLGDVPARRFRQHADVDGAGPG